MKIRIGRHEFHTGFKFAIKSRLSKWFGSYKYPISVWVQHGECCRYWSTDAKEIQNALIQDGFRTKRIGNEVYILEEGEE